MRVIRSHPEAPKHLLPERLGHIKSLFLIRDKKVGGGKEKKGRRLETPRWKEAAWWRASQRQANGEGPSVPADTQDGSCGSAVIFIQLLRCRATPRALRQVAGPPGSFSASCHTPPPLPLSKKKKKKIAPASESQRHIWRLN